jgi:ABC-type antimicrobial peptide transport system permease subunit
VLDRFGTDLHGMDRDNEIVVPVSTMMRRVKNTDAISQAKFVVKDGRRDGDVAEQVRRVLRARHGLAEGRPDDFNLITSSEVNSMESKMERVILLYVPLVGSVALILGGIVGAVLMLASVSERVGEIGLRCAVGAGPADIRRQFVLETTATILLGGIAGIVLGIVLVKVATNRMPINAPLLVERGIDRACRRDGHRIGRRRFPGATRGCAEPGRCAAVKLRRNVGTSLRALFAHRVRAMLAVLSVSVGTAAVIVTSAIGTGADRDIQRGIESLGVNLVVVRPAQIERTVARREVSGATKTLSFADFEAIAELPEVAKRRSGESTVR